MKKLMIALAAVAMAIGAQAATANWQASASNLYNGKGDSAAKYTGTVYFYALTETVTQESVYNAWTANKASVANNAIGTGEVSSGAMAYASNKFSAGQQDGASYSYFFVLEQTDSIYLSKTVTTASNQTETAKSLAFGNQAPTTGASSKSLPTEGYVGVGQWAAAAVPEPTSGLLMLIGMAGLALRRRRA